MQITQGTPVPKPLADTQMWETAKRLEATFLSEMLKSAGLGEVENTFGGGLGEDQFASFLRDAQAKEMVGAGGLGLTEMIFESMKVHENE